MWAYFSVLTIPLLCSWNTLSLKRGISIGLVTYFLVLLVFVGLRYEIGPDWAQYGNIYFNFQYVDLATGASLREPGFFILNKFSDFLGFGFQGVVFVCAFIFLLGMFAYAGQTANAWIAVVVITPYLIFVISMSGIRQAAAIGVIYLVLARWTKSKFTTKLALIMGAATLHTSALFAFVLIIFEDRKWLWAKILLTGLLIGYL